MSVRIDLFIQKRSWEKEVGFKMHRATKLTITFGQVGSSFRPLSVVSVNLAYCSIDLESALELQRINLWKEQRIAMSANEVLFTDADLKSVS